MTNFVFFFFWGGVKYLDLEMENNIFFFLEGAFSKQMKQILSQESVTISLGDHDGRGPKEFGNL